MHSVFPSTMINGGEQGDAPYDATSDLLAEEKDAEIARLRAALERCRQTFWNIRECSGETGIIELADECEKYCEEALK
jgi:hypothetical protein